jgi:hypothetical protein
MAEGGEMRRVGVGVLVMVLAAGCSSGGGGSPEPAPALRQAWALDAFTPVGQPVAAGDVVIAYGTVDRDLLLFGVSAHDGAIRWRQAASPSRTTGGIPLAPSVRRGQVAYLRPDPRASLAARLVIASADTGADLLVSDPMQFLSQPRTCEDDTDVCTTVLLDGRAVPRRFSVQAGGAVADRNAPPAESRYVGTGLLDLGQRQPELLAGFDNGTVRWRVPIEAHFSPGHTTDRGWHIILYREAGLHVGTVGTEAAGDADTGGFDLSKAETAAIRAADGAPAWRADQTSYLCDSRIDLHRAVSGGTEPWPVRCRFRGVFVRDQASPSGRYEGLDVTVEGFSVGTGATTWSVPLGAAEVFMQGKRETIALNGTEVLVHAATGPLILDLSNGATRPAPPGEAFWCGENVFFQYREARVWADGSTTRSWRGGVHLYPCDDGGSPAATTPRSLPPSMGAKVGERVVLAMRERLVAYDPPAPAA